MTEPNRRDEHPSRGAAPAPDPAQHVVSEAATIVEELADEVVRRRAHGIAVTEETWLAMEAAAMPVDEEFDRPDE